jgi:hypothetical protein
MAVLKAAKAIVENKRCLRTIVNALLSLSDCVDGYKLVVLWDGLVSGMAYRDDWLAADGGILCETVRNVYAYANGGENINVAISVMEVLCRVS